MRNRHFHTLALATVFAFGALGCSEESGVQEKTKINTPEGSTTITRDTKIEKSGSNPPGVVTTTDKPVTSTEKPK